MYKDCTYSQNIADKISVCLSRAAWNRWIMMLIALFGLRCLGNRHRTPACSCGYNDDVKVEKWPSVRTLWV